MSPRSRRLALAAIVLLALAARLMYLVLVVGLDSPPEYDGIGYDMIARNLLAGNGFAIETTTAFRPPGYPVLLAGVYAVTGGSLAAVRTLQAIVGAATALLAYRLALGASGRLRIALMAALLAALHPVSIYLTGIVYPEVVACLLVTGAAVLLTPMLRDRTLDTGRCLAAALLLGAGVALRPAVLAFAGLLTIALAWPEVRHRKLPLRAALIPLLVLLFLVPWIARNYRTFGQLIPLATEGGVTFWGGNHPLGNGGHVDPSPETWRGEEPPQGLYGWPGLTETESEDRFYAAAFDWIREEPGAWLKLLPQKVARSWTLAFGNEARDNPLPGWVGKVYLLFPASVLAGLALSWRHRARLVAVYCLLAAQTLTTLAFYGSTRQSALIIPCALVLCAYAVDRVLDLIPGLRETGPSKMSSVG